MYDQYHEMDIWYANCNKCCIIKLVMRLFFSLFAHLLNQSAGCSHRFKQCCSWLFSFSNQCLLLQHVASKSNALLQYVMILFAYLTHVPFQFLYSQSTKFKIHHFLLWMLSYKLLSMHGCTVLSMDSIDWYVRCMPDLSICHPDIFFLNWYFYKVD